MLGWALARGRAIHFGWRDHLRFALLGACLFSVNYYFFYHGGKHLRTAGRYLLDRVGI